ncbi:MAG: hypothetical protein ACD_49C00074G0018 [uncultured bacterium (gcode 4)]|uniref:Uncharacterized protein n=1 Tax=uncultured bacterium (gcode 4) TaxID=1234023 RepID=K2AW54_9BACT|nr:MAG: hypothetical protein ACD_49C00074G0018 [uncultured bacterium (gcode 4)]
MGNLKIITVIFSLFALTWITYATELDDIKSSFTNVQTLIQKYEANLKALQTENETLKKTISELETRINSLSNPHPNTLPKGEGVISTQTWTTQKASSVEKYNQIIDKINNDSGNIFSNNNLSTNSTIWLFEFIEPDAFFISIDDGLNPTGVTAFKTKILYNYDKNLVLKVSWIFSLDYKSWYYITKFGKNPYAKSIRIRVKNPNYKWKLLQDSQVTNSSSTTTTTQVQPAQPTVTATTTTQTVTFEMVKNAYVNNKILDMLKLSNEYIKTDSNNIDVLRMRYRGFHMLGKYGDALIEIQKIQEIQWPNMNKVVACDGSIIAKLAKNNDLSKTYQDICKAAQ